MCGRIFGKGIILFGLTFGVSIFISGFFNSNELPPQNVEIPASSAATQNNCVPADKSLKYQNLPLVEPDFESVKKTKPVESPRSSDKKNQIKELEKKTEEMAEQQFYDSSKGSAEYQTLLYKEQCFAAQEQK